MAVKSRKSKARQTRYNAICGDIPIPASQCQVGDIIELDGTTGRLTAINEGYGIFRVSDGVEYVRMITPDTMVVLVERYIPRASHMAGVDPLTGE